MIVIRLKIEGILMFKVVVKGENSTQNSQKLLQLSANKSVSPKAVAFAAWLVEAIVFQYKSSQEVHTLKTHHWTEQKTKQGAKVKKSISLQQFSWKAIENLKLNISKAQFVAMLNAWNWTLKTVIADFKMHKQWHDFKKHKHRHDIRMYKTSSNWSNSENSISFEKWDPKK